MNDSLKPPGAAKPDKSEEETEHDQELRLTEITEGIPDYID